MDSNLRKLTPNFVLAHVDFYSVEPGCRIEIKVDENTYPASFDRFLFADISTVNITTPKSIVLGENTSYQRMLVDSSGTQFFLDGENEWYSEIELSGVKSTKEIVEELKKLEYEIVGQLNDRVVCQKVFEIWGKLPPMDKDPENPNILEFKSPGEQEQAA
jgi:hypothetical protein